VNIYSLGADGSKGALLGTGGTDDNGAYSISLGSYTGPVLVEAYGKYTDEATGNPLEVYKEKPLRAALPYASGAVALNVTPSTDPTSTSTSTATTTPTTTTTPSTPLSITPLTELAVRQAEQADPTGSGKLTATNISTANTLISDIFKVDITATAPIAPTASAFASAPSTPEGQAQKDYTIVLAAVSQMMETGGTTLEATLNTLNTGIVPETKSMKTETVASIQAAVTTFVASPENKTPVTPDTLASNTTLQNIGLTTKKLTVVLQGSSVASVKGIQATITIPADVLLRADTKGGLLSGVLLAAANAPSGIIEGKYTAAANGNSATVTLGFITSGNMVAGDLLTLAADLSSDVSEPPASAFTLSAVKLIDADGKAVSGVSLVLQ
jgi:hypothetical protein